MNKVSTSDILSVIRDNSELPFYIFVAGDDLYCDSYCMKQISYINIDYVTTFDEMDETRVFVKSDDYDDMVDYVYESLTDDDYEELGYESAIKYAEKVINELSWKKCIVAWTDI